MTIEELVDHFGSVPVVADELGLSRVAVYKWVNNDRIPTIRQCQIERMTDGKLIADTSGMPFVATR